MTADRFRPGDPIPDARWWNQMVADARRSMIVGAGAGLDLSGGGLAVAQVPRIWAQVLGAGNPYGFTEAVADAAGAWQVLPNGRSYPNQSAPAYEANNRPNLGGTYQRLRWSAAGDWRFGDIGSGSPPPRPARPPITIPACFCPVPAHLAMTSVYPACNYGMFQSCTISYQPTPSWAADLGLPDHIFLSDQSFVDTIANASYFYYLYCQYNQFSLTRLYPTSPYGSPYRDALLYSWVLGGYGNTCNPFRLDGGRPYIGSDQTCLVQIDPA